MENVSHRNHLHNPYRKALSWTVNSETITQTRYGKTQDRQSGVNVKSP